MEPSTGGESSRPILHVIVVGFHHKKGCQVEYSYPPLVPGSPNECPIGWKYLPTLALPDGSHNYDEDTVYFHLPSITHPQKTVYGVSCFRQIPVEKLKNRTSDITRGTVQKSVCVLSTQPLYGHIQVKMSLITHAYFEEGDFSKVSLLEDTYRHLNACMGGDSQIPPQLFVGLSARDFILQFRHKALLLFKLLLLERKVVFYQSPVQPLCAAILTLLSLHPGMIESGLTRAACVKPSRPMSPIPTFDHDDDDLHLTIGEMNDKTNEESIEKQEKMVNSTEKEGKVEKSVEKGDKMDEKTEKKDANAEKSDSNYEKNGKSEEIHKKSDDSLDGVANEARKQVSNEVTNEANHNSVILSDNRTLETMEGKSLNSINKQFSQKNHNEFRETNERVASNDSKVDYAYLPGSTPNNDAKVIEVDSESLDSNSDRESLKNQEVHRVQSTNNVNLCENGVLPRDTSSDALSEARVTSNITQIAHIDPELCGLPLNLFSRGYLCLPYLSLPYLDLLGDPNVRGYVVGATNILFKQKKQLIDVLVEVEGARIEATDPELRRQLHLTTEDLRFADYVVRHVAEPRKDVFLDGVGWEGGDEWIRTQFRVYLLSLLRTALHQDSRQADHFNGTFVAAWKTTNNYKEWEAMAKNEINTVEPGHPFAGQLSVQDMKLRLSHTMQNTESGRKINQAMATTGRAVATTGKAVGGAISQAKGAFTMWWSTLTTVQPLDGDVRQEINNANPQISGLTDDSFDEQKNEQKSSNDNQISEIVDKDINSKTSDGAVTMPAEVD